MLPKQLVKLILSHVNKYNKAVKYLITATITSKILFNNDQLYEGPSKGQARDEIESNDVSRINLFLAKSNQLLTI